jgi:hypothetical protein
VRPSADSGGAMMPMKRIMMLLTVALVMAAMMLSMAMPAFAVARQGLEHALGSCAKVASHSSNIPPFCS